MSLKLWGQYALIYFFRICLTHFWYLVSNHVKISHDFYNYPFRTSKNQRSVCNSTWFHQNMISNDFTMPAPFSLDNTCFAVTPLNRCHETRFEMTTFAMSFDIPRLWKMYHTVLSMTLKNSLQPTFVKKEQAQSGGVFWDQLLFCLRGFVLC